MVQKIEVVSFYGCRLVVPRFSTTRFGTASDCTAILDAPDPSTRIGIRDRTMIHVAVTAGLRISELVALRFDDVSFQPRYVEIDSA